MGGMSDEGESQRSEPYIGAGRIESERSCQLFLCALAFRPHLGSNSEWITRASISNFALALKSACLGCCQPFSLAEALLGERETRWDWPRVTRDMVFRTDDTACRGPFSAEQPPFSRAADRELGQNRTRGSMAALEECRQ